MNFSTRFRMSAAILGTLAVLASVTALSAARPKFLPDDPIRVDRDSQDASGMKPFEADLFVDFIYNVIKGRQPVVTGRAKNVNTIDEVPDSSWFTNRAGTLTMTPEQVAQGPNTSSGPLAGTWTVTSSKSDGVTPGFTVKDSSGTKWFLKFDPPGYRGMATGTEVVVTKLMWALGYNVPENHIAYLHRDQLVLGATAKFAQEGGRQRPMRLDDIDHLLQKAEREANGTYRVVASKALEGQPIGRMMFQGTRPDDPNDIVAHEDRRELRGYGTFAAWLNHVDSKAINTLDTLVTRDGRSYVKHHLIDFGSALGSGALGPQDYWTGWQYLIEGTSLKQLLGFGFAAPAYAKVAYFESPALGRLPMDNFDFNPELWKPRIPNQAFLHARIDDKFWAAQKLVTLTTPMLRAAVRTGEFGDSKSEEFLVQALAERRDAIGAMYLTAVNPVTAPALDGYGNLAFGNAAVDADFAQAPQGYRAVWSTFDNATGATTLLATSTGRTTTIEAPANLPTANGSFVTVDVSAMGTEYPAWQTPVRAYFKHEPRGWRLVGFDRMTDASK